MDIPAPVSELNWARSHVDGRRSEWGARYEEVQYDIIRLMRGEYVWPHRDYTLAEIRDCHGICVDQAYFAVLTARAYGIPALYFHGMGKYGGHAWFGFLKSKNEWDLEVGRYSKQGYATGYAIHPQTDQEMTDHALEYSCRRALKSTGGRDALALVWIADLLNEEDVDEVAIHFAQQARRIDSLCEAAWDAESSVFLKNGQIDLVINLLRSEARRFDRYPDVVADIQQRQAALLASSGDTGGAERLLAKVAGGVDSERTDLRRALVMAQARQLAAQGNDRDALRVVEKALRKQRREGAKLFPFFKDYLIWRKR